MNGPQQLMACLFSTSACNTLYHTVILCSAWCPQTGQPQRSRMANVLQPSPHVVAVLAAAAAPPACSSRAVVVTGWHLLLLALLQVLSTKAPPAGQQLPLCHGRCQQQLHTYQISNHLSRVCDACVRMHARWVCWHVCAGLPASAGLQQ